MSHIENLKILSFVGLTGVGKTTATTYLSDRGIPKVSFGSIIRRGMEQAGIEPSEQHERDFIQHLLTKGQSRFVSDHVIPQFHHLIDAGQHTIVADGSSTFEEHQALLHEFSGSFTTIALVAPKHVRHHRLTKRTDHPITTSDAVLRDWAEAITEDKAGPIALADYYIINDGTIDELYQKIDTLLDKINFFAH